MTVLDHYRFKEGNAQKAITRRLTKGIDMPEVTKIISDPFQCNIFRIVEGRKNRIAHRRWNESKCFMWKIY